MREPASVTYVRMETADPDSKILGYYKVRYEDNLTVAMPHIGVQHTLSAQPLDVDDPYERSLLLNGAAEVRAQVPDEDIVKPRTVVAYAAFDVYASATDAKRAAPQ